MHVIPSRSHTTIDTFATFSGDEIVEASSELLSWPTIAITVRERIFRIESAGLDWDVGIVVLGSLLLRSFSLCGAKGRQP